MQYINLNQLLNFSFSSLLLPQLNQMLPDKTLLPASDPSKLPLKLKVG